MPVREGGQTTPVNVVIAPHEHAPRSRSAAPRGDAAPRSHRPGRLLRLRARGGRYHLHVSLACPRGTPHLDRTIVRTLGNTASAERASSSSTTTSRNLRPKRPASTSLRRSPKSATSPPARNSPSANFSSPTGRAASPSWNWSARSARGPTAPRPPRPRSFSSPSPPPRCWSTRPVISANNSTRQPSSAASSTNPIQFTASRRACTTTSSARS